MIDPFLFNTLVEGPIGILALGGVFVRGVPHFWSPAGTAEGRYGVMSELLAFQFATFASIPSLVVWLKGSSREAGMPVAAGALLYHVALAVLGVYRGLTSDVGLGPDVALVPMAMRPFANDDIASGKVMSAVAGVLHGLLAISFARWILKGGKAARKTKTA
ncbi:hypothetical protein BC831DRAFT_485234 [Entophlyctis helioformis]|nr:hypothetical protein BC831DRAFT_485234 [Entophlyctis helioformis]